MDAAASHIWQSTLVGGVAAALALMLRNNRASVRYWVWFAASMKFLVPFAALGALGSALPWPGQWLPESDTVAAVNVLFHSSALASVSDASVFAIVAVWLAGVLIVLAKWFREWSRLAAIARAADPITDGPVHDALRRVESVAGRRISMLVVCSRHSLEPGVFGCWRPVLMWPHHLTAGMSDAQIEPILAHEVSHVIRRDNLLGTAQMIVSALFWFHPMVWWIGARMIDERERACDERVLALGQNPLAYAAGILKTCELCIASPLVSVSGITGGDLKKRIARISRNEVGAPLDSVKKAVVAILTTAVFAAPIVAGACGLRQQPAVPQADATGVQRPGPDVQTPKLLREVKPQYPERAMNAKIEGEVLMECVVRADGRPSDFKIVRSLDPQLDQAALDAAKQWEFEPGTRRGKPVPVMVTIAIAFTLK